MPRDLCDAAPHLSGVRFQLWIHNRIQVYESASSLRPFRATKGGICTSFTHTKHIRPSVSRGAYAIRSLCDFAYGATPLP